MEYAVIVLGVAILAEDSHHTAASTAKMAEALIHTVAIILAGLVSNCP